MKAALMNGAFDVTIGEIEKPVPKKGEVLVRIKAVGVCGSDMHYYIHGRMGSILIDPPFILGHEAAGIVEETGEGVTSVSVGDRVALEPGIPCGVCEHCRSGHYNLCEKMAFLACPPYDGAFCEYMAYPEEWLFKLPDNVSYTEGALVEPLAVGFHAAQISGISLGETAFIFGCGCIGLLCLSVLKSRGVSRIYMSDLIKVRREKAMEYGATQVFDPSCDDIPAEIAKLTEGRGVDAAFEMTGSEAALTQAIEVVRKGGNVVLVGLGKEVMQVNVSSLIWKEVQLWPCFRYKNIYPRAINAISSGQIHVSDIVSNEVRLDEVPEMLKYHYDNMDSVTKMVVLME